MPTYAPCSISATTDPRTQVTIQLLSLLKVRTNSTREAVELACQHASKQAFIMGAHQRASIIQIALGMHRLKGYAAATSRSTKLQMTPHLWPLVQPLWRLPKASRYYPASAAAVHGDDSLTELRAGQNFKSQY